MRRAKSWFLIGLVSAACIVPDVEVVDSDDDSMSSSGKSATSGGKASSAGTGASPESGSPGEEGGSPGASPVPPGGSGASPVPSAGSGPTPPAPAAFGKFCNDITFGGESITLTLTIGTGVKKVVFSAASGACKPVSGTACTPIPVGTGIPVTLSEGSDPIVTYPVDIEDGASWIFLAYTDGESADIAGDPVTPDVCELGYDAPSPGG